MDLHSGRSQVDFKRLADLATSLGADRDEIVHCNTANQALGIVGAPLACAVAAAAREQASLLLSGADVDVDILMIDRAGSLVALVDSRGAYGP